VESSCQVIFLEVSEARAAFKGLAYKRFKLVLALTFLCFNKTYLLVVSCMMDTTIALVDILIFVPGMFLCIWNGHQRI
jgi:hypothetical protein